MFRRGEASVKTGVEMHIRKCRTCGFSYWLTRIVTWHDNGTLTWKHAPDIRLVIIRSDLLSNVFSHLEDRLGLPIAHIVFEAQRNAVAAGIDAMLTPFPFSLGRVGPNKRLVVRAFCRLSLWMGTAYARAILYRPGREGQAILRNPYNRDLMGALILGAFEALERKPFAHEWKKVDGDDVIRVTAAAKKPEFSERLQYTQVAAKPGGHALARCPSCGAPRDLGSLQWHEDEGTITDTGNGVRVNFLDGGTPGIVFRELERELGTDIYPLIVEASVDSFREQSQLSPTYAAAAGTEPSADVFGEYLSFLPTYGQGLARDIAYSGGELKVSVDNPYDRFLLAGYLAALYDKAVGGKATVTWEAPDPTSVTYTLRPD